MNVNVFVFVFYNKHLLTNNLVKDASVELCFNLCASVLKKRFAYFLPALSPVASQNPNYTSIIRYYFNLKKPIFVLICEPIELYDGTALAPQASGLD